MEFLRKKAEKAEKLRKFSKFLRKKVEKAEKLRKFSKFLNKIVLLKKIVEFKQGFKSKIKLFFIPHNYLKSYCPILGEGWASLLGTVVEYWASTSVLGALGTGCRGSALLLM